MVYHAQYSNTPRNFLKINFFFSFSVQQFISGALPTKRILYTLLSLKGSWKYESDMTYGQIWWPILGIHALHLPIQSVRVHTHTHTHTEQWAAIYALLKGTSVVVLRRALDIHSPHLQFRRKLSDLETLKLSDPETRTRNLWITSPTL